MNVSKMMQQKSEIVKGLTQGIEGLFKKNKVTHINATGTITNANQVALYFGDNKSDKIETDKILIATGSENVSLPGINIDEKTIVSSTGALSLESVPKKLVVIGAGVIGLELGSVWARLGSEVEVIEFADRACPTMDKDLSKTFQKSLEKQGMKFRLNTKVTKATNNGGKVNVEIESIKDSKKENLSADVVLVSIGRKAYIENLGAIEAGVKLTDRGAIEVNEKFQTSVKNIYAIGDVIPGPMLAHKAEDEGVICAEMMAGQSGHIDYNLVPSVVYTYPEVASVGQTEEQLKEAGIEYKAGKFSMMANSRARSTLSAEGFVKILSCKKTDKLLGCHIISREAGNLIR
jgi:dihydrolipoamide dehydrogenase